MLRSGRSRRVVVCRPVGMSDVEVRGLVRIRCLPRHTGPFGPTYPQSEKTGSDQFGPFGPSHSMALSIVYPPIDGVRTLTLTGSRVPPFDALP